MLTKIVLLTITVFVIPTYALCKEETAVLKSAMTHNKTYNMTMQESSEATIQLSIQKIKEEGQKKRVQIKLSKIKNESPVTLNDLKEIHTQKIHLLIIDNGLEDYSHVHPTATQTPGVYEFEWLPKSQGYYRIWADLFPVETNIQEYVIADLTESKNIKPKTKKTLSLKSTMGDLTFTLAFNDKILQANKASIGTIHIADSKSQPLKDPLFYKIA